MLLVFITDLDVYQVGRDPQVSIVTEIHISHKTVKYCSLCDKRHVKSVVSYIYVYDIAHTCICFSTRKIIQVQVQNKKLFFQEQN